MRSSRREPNNRRQTYLSLVRKVEGQLRDGYAKRNEAGLDTQSSIAEKLGVHRSVVHHRLTGRQNMTLETLADMVWALGLCIDVDIYDPEEKQSNEPRVLSEHRFAIAQPAPWNLAVGTTGPTGSSSLAVVQR